MHPVNTELHDAFILRTDANVAITGAVAGDFAVLTAALVSTPATTAVVTLAEVGTGQYRIRFTPPTVGRWGVRIVYDVGDVFREWLGVYDVVTAAQFDPAASLLAQGVVLAQPAPASASMTVVRGDDYLDADERAFAWDLTNAPDLTGAAVTWQAVAGGQTALSKALTVVDDDTVRLELTDADTLTLRSGAVYAFSVVAVIGASTVTLVTGTVTVQ